MSLSRSSSIRVPAGFSTLELLVAVAITAVLLGGVAAVSQRIRLSYKSTHEQIELQTQAKHALNQMARDLRSAGFNGCVRSYQAAAGTAQSQEPLDPRQAIRGFHAGEHIGSDEVLPFAVVPGTDILLIIAPQRGAPLLTLQRPVASDPAEPIVLSGTSISLKPGDWLMVYTCEQRGYFRVAQFTDGSVRYDKMLLDSVRSLSERESAEHQDLAPLFDTDAGVLVLETVAYFVAPSASPGTDSLWRKVGGREPQELSNSVKGLHLRFGTSSDRQLPSEEVSDWSAINLISASLELSAPGRSRRTTGATFSLRNRS